jgi:hypothetical protein
METLKVIKKICTGFFCWALLFIGVASQPAFSQTYSSRQTPQQVEGGFETRFWAYVPENYPADGDYPLLISLHGGSAIGSNLSELLDPAHDNPAYLISANRWFDLPFVVVSPQMELDPGYSGPNEFNEQNWPEDQVDELIDYVVANYNIDESRIYVTGISLGAAGTWNYAAAHPERVAAILPLGGKTPRGEACSLKDVPIWVFHGENDFLVRTRFTTDMVDAINNCSPAGKYIPHVNLAYSMEHPVWNEVYNKSGGYDVYEWLLAFEKGDDSNRPPFVYPGLNKRILKPASHFYLTAEYFDSDGTVTNVQWSQVDNGSPMLSLEDATTRFLKINTATATADANYTFRLTVIDNDGASSFRDVTVRLLSLNDERAVTAMELTGQFGGPVLGGPSFGMLTNDAEYDLKVTGDKINILATTQGSTRIKWGINSDQHVRNSSTPSYVKAPNNGTINSGWTITIPGDYLVCATAFSNSPIHVAQEFTTLCYKIKFRNDVGVTKYYLNGLDPAALTAWKTGEDGTGASPTSFSDNDQWFHINKTATTAGAVSIGGTNSKLIIGSVGKLTVGHLLTGTVDIEGNGSVEIISGGSIATFGTVSRTSTVVYNTTSTILIPLSEFGHLTLRGAGQKLFTPGVTLIRGNLKAETGALIINTSMVGGVPTPSSNGSVEIRASGNVDIATTTTHPYTLRFIEGYGNQYLRINNDHAFKSLFMERGITVNLQTLSTATVIVGSGNTGGILEVHDFGLFKLNGNNIRLINSAALNPTTSSGVRRRGKIALSGSTITVAPLTPLDSTLNLYPAQNSKDLKSLVVTLPAGHKGFKIQDSLNITQGVRVINGKIHSNSRVTLLSTPTSTAYVDKIEGTAQIVGNVNVQRVVGNGRMYRYLSFPVKNFTVAKLQQFIPVTGTFQDASTGPGLSTTPSLYVWNEPDYEWSPYPAPASNNTQPLEIGKGYAVYVRDDNNDTRMVLTGELHQGPHTFSINQNTTGRDTLGWTLIGNPYAAPVLWEGTDPDSPPLGWTPVNIDPSIYIRDNELEGFRVWDGEIGDVPDGIVAIGQSFWVRAENAAASLSINESAKQQLTSPMLYRNKRSDVVALTVALKQNERQSNAYIKFKPTGNSSWIRGRDTIKKNGDKLNVSILSSDNHSLAIKTLCDSLCSQEIGLLVRTAKRGTYSISISGSAFDHVIHKLFIFDKFMDQKVEWKEDEDYVFQVTSDPASHTRDRFHLIIEKDNVEKPTIRMEDGYLLSTVSDGGQWALNGVDIEGATGAVLLPEQEGEYTIRTIGKSCSKTSEPFNFRVTGIQEKLPEVRVYPNPARNHVKISGLRPTAFDAQFEITTLSGAIIQQGPLDVSAAGEGEIRLKSASPGFYILRISDGAMHQLKFTVQP